VQQVPLQLIWVCRQHRSCLSGGPVMLFSVQVCCGMALAAVLQQSRLPQHSWPTLQHERVAVSPHTLPATQHACCCNAARASAAAQQHEQQFKGQFKSILAIGKPLRLQHSCQADGRSSECRAASTVALCSSCPLTFCPVMLTQICPPGQQLSDWPMLQSSPQQRGAKLVVALLKQRLLGQQPNCPQHTCRQARHAQSV
jgi:hypothetical protein